VTAWLAAASLAVAIALAGRPPPAARIAAWQGDPGADDAAFGSSRAVWLTAGLAGSVMIAARVALPLIAAVAVLSTIARRVAAVRRASRLRDSCSAATVEVTFALAGELRAGRTPAQALAAVVPSAGPLASALEAAQAAVALGASPAAELASAAVIPGAERLGYVAAAWQVAESAGGKVAVVLERLSEAMDSDEELRQELDAAMAGPRATMVLLAGLPLLGLALGQAVGAQPLHLLLHRPLGWGLLTAAVALDALGLMATKAIARAALGR
jgi:tight adherence protein B